MSFNATIGLVLIAFAATAIAALVLWSRHIINRIDRSGPRSARMILRDLASPATDAPPPAVADGDAESEAARDE
jgi:hypothetical protein